MSEESQEFDEQLRREDWEENFVNESNKGGMNEE